MTDPQAAHTSGQIQWEPFLRAFAGEIDGAFNAPLRDMLLRRAGAQMARDLALPPAATLEAFQTKVSERLAELGWGDARFTLDEASRVLHIVHSRLPTFDAAPGSSRSWLSSVLEGLYAGWLGQQPNAKSHLVTRRLPPRADGLIALAYGRVDRIDADNAAASTASSRTARGKEPYM